VAGVMYNKLIVCPHCGNETPEYEDCILCGHSLQDPDALPRDVTEDEIQTMMIDAKLQEIKVKRGILFGDRWDHAPWLERLQTLARIAPDHPKVHYYIGAAQTEMGEHRQAIVSFTRAMIGNPTLADAVRRRGDCQYLLVPVLADDVQAYYDRALADYEATLELDPDVYTYNAHASIIASLGRVDEAIQEYDRAIELNPDYPETYFNRGYAFELQGKVEQAVADFEQFLSFESHWNEEMVTQARSHIKDLTEPE
jgi:tetratricopeptide (TPR) repeat protein